MAFTLPNFNLVCNIWRNASGSSTVPPSVPPLFVVPCNLALGPRTWIEATVIDNQWLLLPWGTDIRDGIRENTGLADWVEVPAGSGLYWKVDQVLFAGMGWPNAHVAAIIQAGGGVAPPQPLPYIPPAPPPPLPLTWVLSNQQGPAVAGWIDSFPQAASNMLLVVTVFNPAGVAPTMTSAFLGPIAPLITSFGPTQHGLTAVSCTFQWAHPGGTDTYTFAMASNGAALYNYYATVAGNFDVGGGNNGGPGTLTVTASGPTTGANRLLCAHTGGFDETADALYPGTWSRPQGADRNFPMGGFSVYDSVAFIVLPAVGTPTVSIGITGPGTAQFVGQIVAIF